MLQQKGSLSLVATALSAATRLLEFAALAADVGLCVGVGDTGSAAVLDGLASILGATHENAVGARGRQQRQLVKGQDLAAGLRHTRVQSQTLLPHMSRQHDLRLLFLAHAGVSLAIILYVSSIIPSCLPFGN